MFHLFNEKKNRIQRKEERIGKTEEIRGKRTEERRGGERRGGDKTIMNCRSTNIYIMMIKSCREHGLP